MNVFLVLFVIFACLTLINTKEYPEKTLKCYSYLTKPDKKLICPAARAKYCVKEVTTLTQNLCGQTQYFGDLYEQAQCQFKKCSAECVEGTYNFEYNGQQYSRTRYCCDTDYCNSAPVSKSMSLLLILFSVCVTMLYLL